MDSLPSGDGAQRAAWRRRIGRLTDDWEYKLLFVVAAAIAGVQLLPWTELDDSVVLGALLAALSSMGALLLSDRTTSRERAVAEARSAAHTTEELAAVHRAVDHLNLHLREVATARVVGPAAFYDELDSAIRAATTRIALTQHAELPPAGWSLDSATRYFGSIDEVVRSGRVTVTRIVSLQTPEKIAWVEHHLVPLFSGVERAHLRVAPAVFFTRPDLHMPLSLQLVDEAMVFMINAPRTIAARRGQRSHEPLDDTADLILRSPSVTRYFRRYYDNYWDKCLPLVEAGVVNPAGLEHIAARKADLTAPPPDQGPGRDRAPVPAPDQASPPDEVPAPDRPPRAASEPDPDGAERPPLGSEPAEAAEGEADVEAGARTRSEG